jgi:hypothetical protein
MSYVFGNSSAYDYDLYTTGGQSASVKCSSLIQNTAADNYVVIVDISNTIQGTYSYSVNGTNRGNLTKEMCPFLISDISGLTDISCSITFTPSENRDGYGSIFYYTLSRYTPIVKTQIRQVSNEDTINDELVINNFGYEPFQTINTPLYCYSSIENPDRIILLDTATVADTSTYFNTTGIPTLHDDGTINLTWKPVIDELGYGPKDLTVYNNTSNYYLIPLILEFFEDGSFTTYTNENLIVSNGTVYRYTPETRTIGVAVGDDGSYVGGSLVEAGRTIQILRDVDGTLSSPQRVYYAEYADLIYRPYQSKQIFKHSNRAPTVASGSFTVASYNIETIVSALGTSVASILANPDFSFVDENAEYDSRGIIIGGSQVSTLTGNWAYRYDGDVDWKAMTFTSTDSANLYWYLPEKKNIGGVAKDVYIKFITTMNAAGSASLQVYGWDRTNTSGPVEGPERAELISYSATGARSSQSATLIQTMEKINYPPIYNTSIIGNSYTSVDQDSTISITFNTKFFSDIGFTDVSGPGPGVGIVIEDVSGAGVGTWGWKYQYGRDTLTPFNFSNGGFHIKQYNDNTNNIIMQFVPDKYKYGSASFRARLWDTSVDVLNGSYASIPSVYDPHGSYSAESKTWTITINNLPDSPKLYDNNSVEIVDTFTNTLITYGQGYTPLDDGSDSITVSSILKEFGITRIFGSKIVDVDSNFIDYDITKLGIAIEDISGPVDISFQRFISAGNWRTYAPSDFISGQQRRYLHLNNTDIFRFSVSNAILGKDVITFRFRIWNRKNISDSSLSLSISQYSLINAPGPYYSIPITASITYDDTNQAPVINIGATESTYSYSLGSQIEDSGDSVDFDIGGIIQTLYNTSIGNQPLITDVDGSYITQIPLFGLALTEAPAVADFSNAGTWKYRTNANAQAVSLNFANGFFHVASGVAGAQPKIFYSPNKNTYGAIKLVARIWDRSNEADVSAGMYRPYTGSYDRIAPYSAKTITFNLNIEGRNDRPFLLSGRMFLNTISFTDTNPTGQTIYNIMQSNDQNSAIIVADPDPQDIGSHGIVITGLSDARLGTWQYMVDGSTWLSVQVGSQKGIHLRAKSSFGAVDVNSRLRFLPNPELTKGKTGARLFQYYIWDTTNGVENGAFQSFDPQNDTSYSLISYTGRIIVG